MKPLKIVMRDTAALMRDPQNARLHPPHQIEKLKAAISRFGFLNPIIIADGVIIAGHARLEAARELEMAKIPAIDAGHLTETDRRAFALADNRISEDGGWSMELLRANFEALKDEGFPIDGLGFRQEEIDAALSFSMDFQPELAPTTAGRQITEADIASQQGAQDATFAERGTNKPMLAVTCPHCASEFSITVPQ